jgi:hypothetical protein
MAKTATNDVVWAGLAEYLQDLVLNSSDVEVFLQELAVYSAGRLSGTDREIYCGITLVRRKRSITIASSDETARELDEQQARYGDGPCLTAIRENRPVLVPDADVEIRWPEYMEAVREHGIRAILGVPFALDGAAEASLNVYSGSAHTLSGPMIDRAEAYALRASKALNLSVRMAQLTEARDNLKAAMESRTTIDLAVGVIMGQNRCNQDAAFEILRKASSARNVKLREIASTIVAGVNQGREAETRFDE